MPSELEWCPLEDYPSLEALLKTAFSASGQLIKRQNLSKAFLERPVHARSTLRLPLNLVNHREVAPWYEGPAVKCLGEDDEYLMLHKPPGVHTHPQGYEESANLVNWLACERPALTRVNSQGADRGCLWRLDRETSGLVLYAKSDEAYQRLRRDFASAFKRKLYLAVVRAGAGSQARVEHFLTPTGPKGQRMRAGHAGERALLAYRTLAEQGGFALLLVTLETGLRHQIRAQLSALGHPILGDELYGGEKAARLMLHCWRYETAQHVWEDREAELFAGFFDLHRLLQMVHDELG